MNINDSSSSWCSCADRLTLKGAQRWADEVLAKTAEAGMAGDDFQKNLAIFAKTVKSSPADENAPVRGRIDFAVS